MPRLMLIRTRYDPKPIPIRSHDWDAWIDGEEERFGTAHGATEGEAVQELAETVESRLEPTLRLREQLRKSLEQVTA